MKKALIIGSEGNIGAPLCSHLKDKGYKTLEVDIIPGWRKGYLMADINFPVDLLPAFDWKPDVVFLLSAMVSRVTCEQASSLAISTNLSGINNVIQLCKKHNSKLVFFSTSEVYGPDCDPMDEAISDPKPNNRYGLSKLLGEQLVEYEVRANGLKAVSLRPFMMYDENEDLGDHRSAMIRFAHDLILDKPITVHKNSSRGWFHVSDAVRAIEAAAHTQEYSVINIGHPNIVPIAELAEMVREQVGADRTKILYTDLPEKMTLKKNPTLFRQAELLGVQPKVELKAGVKLVCDKVKMRLKKQT